MLELGNTLCALAKIVPGGMLIFFPSYSVMDTCIEAWGGPSNKSSWSGNRARKDNFFAKRLKSNSGSNGNKYSFPRVPDYYNTGNLTPWKRMLTHKAIVIEPKNASDMKDAIEEFDKHIEHRI